MSDYAASENGRSEDFSLNQAVEEIRQHGFAQIENLREKQKTLSTLQANLLETEKKGEMVEKELRSKIRKILAKEAEIEQLEKEINVLNDRQTLVSKENADLRRRIGEEEEDARKVLAQFSTYRTKMEGHRVAVWLVASRGEAQKVLEEKKASVRKLKKKREELREDLDKPNGSTVEKAKVEAVVHAWVSKSSCYSELLLFKNLQREIDALEVEISAMKKTVVEKRARLLEETETHAQFKEDAEIQNRRFEAIVRRLRLQLSRAQVAHRQVCDDVRRLEGELAELKLRL